MWASRRARPPTRTTVPPTDERPAALSRVPPPCLPPRTTISSNHPQTGERHHVPPGPRPPCAPRARPCPRDGPFRQRASGRLGLAVPRRHVLRGGQPRVRGL